MLRSVHRSPIPLAVLFTLAGTLHFTHPRFYLAIMPPYLPWHRELIYISGAAEIAGGLAALSPQLRPWARWWLIALLVAVFPANVHTTIHPEQVRGLDVSPVVLWARLPLQAVFIAWVWSATSRRS